MARPNPASDGYVTQPPARHASMMLLTFSRGSRQRNTNRASGKRRSRNGIRNEFFGVFSTQRRLPAWAVVGAHGATLRVHHARPQAFDRFAGRSPA